MQQVLPLSPQQVDDIARLLELDANAHVTEISKHNHVWQFADGQNVYFLKTFTKSWYGDDVPGTSYCVKHEQDAYACLAAHGLTTPEVILARKDCDNPLGRPFIVTRKLKGESLMAHLAAADSSQFQALLERTGNYMRRMHAISFAFPGYIIGDGPTSPPDEDEWQHPCWSARQTQKEAVASLEHDRSGLSTELVATLEKLFSSMTDNLASSFQPPHFVQVNCHAHQFYLWKGNNGWEVTGCIDLEVASAGCSLYDLVGFSIEMAAFFPHATGWWEPYFQCYGKEPDFSLFKLMMLGLPEICFRIYGEMRWSGTRQQILTGLLTASNWSELFTTRGHDALS